MSREIFALDIGTRKVMGIVASVNDDYTLDILDTEVAEHANRPMFDGQIHSIDEVVKTVRAVKQTLESRMQKALTKAGVAVAGRNLVTYKTRTSKEFDSPIIITQQILRELELEAVDKIISGEGNKLSQFYCVGYSPVYYELEGEKISNLSGHYAKSISLEVIATFLPKAVLNSMFAVLEKSGIEATNITLEPISAINAIIPPEMRNLNLVLVDIGAGTSDLALTKDGVIFSYGMVPEAGDEIMEKISEVLLADFSGAERIKRLLGQTERLEYEDIWGRRHCADTAVIKQKAAPAVKKLADSIARAGLELNGGDIPHAVVLVGGGSLTFDLVAQLAESFGLTPDKAGIRLPVMIKGVSDRTGKLTGPEAVTALGIAIMTAQSIGLRFINIEVNSKKFKLLDFHQKKDVMGALTLYNAENKSKLSARPGLALTAKVNGELKIIKGSLGSPAKLLLNGKPVESLSEKISDGDILEFEEASDGQDASALVKDFVCVEPLAVTFNGENLLVRPPVVMNGRQVDLDTQSPDRANIDVGALKIKDVLIFKGEKIEELSERQILVNINDSPRILTQQNFILRLNSKPADLNTEVGAADIIEFTLRQPTLYKVKDVVDVPDKQETMSINVDGRQIRVKLDGIRVFMNGRHVETDEFLINGADIKVHYSKNNGILLSEIFRYIDFDPRESIGKSMKFLVDEKPAGFITPLKDGSRVRILFEDRAL